MYHTYVIGTSNQSKRIRQFYVERSYLLMAYNIIVVVVQLHSTPCIIGMYIVHTSEHITYARNGEDEMRVEL